MLSRLYVVKAIRCQGYTLSGSNVIRATCCQCYMSGQMLSALYAAKAICCQCYMSGQMLSALYAAKAICCQSDMLLA